MNVFQHNRCAVQVINGHVEKSLDLVSMQVDSHKSADANGRHHVSNNFCRDRYAGRTHASILACITEIGNNSGNAGCRSAAQGIRHDDQFHQVVIRRCTGGLNNEDIASTHIFLNFNHGFAITESSGMCFAQRQIQVFNNPLSKLLAGISVEDHYFRHVDILGVL
jgi:hypothetical protein